jgi:hypothetical protein
VDALIAGGLTWVSARPPAQHASPTVEALQRGDWDEFWKELGVPISDADRQLIELSDPRAMGRPTRQRTLDL